MDGFLELHTHQRVSLSASKQSSQSTGTVTLTDDDDVVPESDPEAVDLMEHTPVKVPVKRRRVAVLSSSESDGSPVRISRKNNASNVNSPPWLCAKSRKLPKPTISNCRTRTASTSSEEENNSCSAMQVLKIQRKLKNGKKVKCPKNVVEQTEPSPSPEVVQEEEVVEVEEEEMNEEEDSDEIKSDKKIARKQRERLCVEFFNTASVEEIEALNRVKPEAAKIITTLRPFTNFDHLCDVFEATKRLSLTIIDNKMQTIRLQMGLDELLKACRHFCANVKSTIKTAKQPKIMTTDLILKDYQLLGLGWLQSMDKNKLNAILADEMGLGKTIQVIAFLSWLKETGRNGPHLICVPSSTLDNWKSELERWSPQLNVVVYYGDMSERLYIRKHMRQFDDVNIVLTTYNMISSKGDDRKFFRKTHLEYSVFDEAHMLKNANTNRYNQLLRVAAKRTILMTGTPMQNNLGELISLIHFVMPQLVTEHVQDFSDLLAHFQKKDEKGIGEYEREKIQIAKQILSPFYLRRIKSEILSQLPAKVEDVIYCSLKGEQQSLYSQAVQNMKDENDESGNMRNLMILRKLANHPLLYRKQYDEDTILQIAKKLYAKDKEYFTSKVEYIADDLSFMTDMQIHQLCQKHKCIKSFSLDRALFSKSAKLGVLKEILENYKKKGEKVLVFSQFVMVLDLLDIFLEDLGYSYLRLDGQTPVKERLDLINQFNSDPNICVFILSTKAGGLGINLTAANNIVLHDIDWNPYNDKQAEDRCHRLGQTKTVTVIKLIAKGTVEEGILALAQSKLLLEMQVTGNPDMIDEEDASKASAKLLKEAFSKTEK